MRIVAKAGDVDRVEVEMTIRMTIAEWRVLKGDLGDEVFGPIYYLRQAINRIIDTFVEAYSAPQETGNER